MTATSTMPSTLGDEVRQVSPVPVAAYFRGVAMHCGLVH
jgi:hypothetical protein